MTVESITPPRTRILIVDDSAVIRMVITRTLTPCEDMEVVGTANNGEAAIRAVKLLKPDIVILDIEMPVMDGITALPLILQEKPDARVLICSTLSARGADISVRALSLGATECILKPGGDSISTAADFQKDLVALIRSLSRNIRRHTATATIAEKRPAKTITLNAAKAVLPPRILAIGSSTGGPKILMDVLKDLQNLPVPIVITQHMPKTFTKTLAHHIQQNCNIPCFEGEEGMVLENGSAYVAPGGFHMILQKSGDQVKIHLDEGEPENYCRPSVNPMLRSLIAIYGSRILTTILTGMGSDGLTACQQLVSQGGQVIAQDEETSVVWGMPGAVANAGICTAVLPSPRIAQWIKGSFGMDQYGARRYD